jgi:hypothetical protein
MVVGGCCGWLLLWSVVALVGCSCVLGVDLPLMALTFLSLVLDHLHTLHQLIFLPPTSRAAVGILICVVCCCTLNYFRPHRNKTVLFVSQMSFLMSTFKYVCAVFLRLNDLTPADATVVGWIMVMLDVVFMLGSVVAIVVVVVLLRASVNTVQGDNQALVGGGDGEEGVSRRSLVQVVPMPQAEGEEEEGQQQSSLNKGIAGTLARVKSTRTKTVEKIEKNHQRGRDLAVQNIKQKQVQRRNSLQLRVQARNEKKNARESVAVNKKASRATVEMDDGATVEKVLIQKEAATTAAATSTTASVQATNIGATKENIETLRLTLCETMETPDKFQTWMAQYDKALTGLLLQVHLTKMIQKIAKKMGKGGVKEGFVEAVWASMKQGSGEEVAWDVIEHEVVKRWVFGEVKVGGGGSSKRVGGHGRGVGGGVLSTLAMVALVGLVWGTVSVGAVVAPADRDALKAGVGSCSYGVCTGGCLGETADGSCPTFAASNDATGNPYGVIGDLGVSSVISMYESKCHLSPSPWPRLLLLCFF